MKIGLGRSGMNFFCNHYDDGWGGGRQSGFLCRRRDGLGSRVTKLVATGYDFVGERKQEYSTDRRSSNLAVTWKKKNSGKGVEIGNDNRSKFEFGFIHTTGCEPWSLQKGHACRLAVGNEILLAAWAVWVLI